MPSTGFVQSETDRIATFERYKQEAVRYENIDLDTNRLYIDSCVIAAKRIHNPFFTGDAYQMKSRDFFMRSLPDSALIYGKKSIEIFTGFPDSSAQYVAEYNLGNIYLSMGEYIQALVQFKKVLRIIDLNFDNFVTGNDERVNLSRAYCYLSIGVVYDHLEDYPKKLQNLQRGLKISYKVHTHESEVVQAITLGNIGLTYFQLGDYEKAESYAIAGMEQKKRLGIDNTIGYNYQVLAEAAYGRKKYALSQKYLQLADQSFREIQNENELRINQLLRAKNYFAQKKHDLALELLLPLEKDFSAVNAKGELIELYDLLSEIYASLGDYKKALDYQKVSRLISDDLSAKNSVKAVDEFMVFFRGRGKPHQR